MTDIYRNQTNTYPYISLPDPGSRASLSTGCPCARRSRLTGQFLEERGAAMSLAAAAEYALMLIDPGPAQPAAPGSGPLSARERELVTLVARGRTNAQIAAQLYISIRTVGSHLDRIRDKTGCRRRADLARLALSEGLV
jgi:DNA-binding CsgD family transcriptional regulator